ncbi:hypothetical protein HMPREF9104_00553 [Lentilactobacillus kisonensis F0435]|uniref:Uncharacterized protein n=1 Tax=Lentilactobacillus kisonensis F0435 TaxID=797516 RepID=H1LD89_9LACO|nr:hypothetical protein HMPREF9104_00553 [Lentilactobacillus kisonensis F0435]
MRISTLNTNSKPRNSYLKRLTLRLLTALLRSLYLGQLHKAKICV